MTCAGCGQDEAVTANPEAGAPQPTDADLAEALKSARLIVSRDPRDWSVNRHDAFLFGMFRGWDDPADERAAADRHGWDDAFVERLHRLAAGVTRVIGPPSS
jgi:hypothetical protein